MQIKIYPLNKFRRLKEFSKVFKITDDTVIAYDSAIYSNKQLHDDVLVHERVHLAQQKQHGLRTFIDKYLTDKKFRLEMEKEAYQAQLASIKDKGLREAVRKDSIEGIVSGLYGKITRSEAETMLPKDTDGLDVNKLI